MPDLRRRLRWYAVAVIVAGAGYFLWFTLTEPNPDGEDYGLLRLVFSVVSAGAVLAACLVVELAVRLSQSLRSRP